MKNWATAIFPISVLGVLAGLSFWLLHVTDIKEEKTDGKNRHDPDYIISGMQMNKLNKAGKLQYTFTAKETRHYPDDDTTDVTLPHLVYFSPSKPTLTMSSLTAHVNSEGEIVQMQDDVQIKRDATPTRAALFGYMADLTIHTEEETASTKTPVLFTQGKSWLKGVGMHIDNKTQTYVLESQAVGQFESRKAKAKP
ncbi:MAG: lipopolysaccharide export system protein LptC [Pseudomonadota bacterium]|jgi:lipopolysaccharide export system protein LptC|nr:lipopolysaccharide export system protein LptC [Pseudomonadota bacterium]MDQ5915748.1 lipopolysaccharide export system protein LptC [Pseudomonadota bacterium]